MLKLEFFKTADEFVSKVKKGSVVAYHADHQNYRHMLQLAGSYVGKTKFGFDLAPIRNFRELKALEKYEHIFIVPSMRLMNMIALNVNEDKTSLLIDLTGFDKIPAALPSSLVIHRCDLAALLESRPNVKFIVNSSSIQGFELTRSINPDNVIAFASPNQCKALMSNVETIFVATFDQNVSREMFSLLFRPKETVEMIVVPRTASTLASTTVSELEDIPSDLFD